MLSVPKIPSIVARPVLRTGLALLLLCTVFAGCYSYQPVIREELTPGDPLRLRLSAQTAQEVSDRVGSPVRSVEGPLLRATADSLRIDVGWGAYYAGTMFEGRRDTLQFHRGQVLEIDRKQFSRVRTGVVVGALVVAIVYLFKAIDLGGQGGSDPPIDPQQIRIPTLRIPAP